LLLFLISLISAIELNKEPNVKESFEVVGRVETVLVAHTFNSHISTPVEKINVLIREGVRGDIHAGRRLVDVREKELLSFGLPKRMEIANHREFSALSIEEMSEISQAMGVPDLPPGLLGENLIVSGIPRFTQLPVGTKLFFKKNNVPQTAVLVVWGENTPCKKPSEALQQHYSELPNIAASFVRHAVGKRGVVGSVYSSGVITQGDIVIAKIPKQYTYEPPSIS
jgi:hypothetical protein